MAIGDAAQSHETNSALSEGFTPDLFHERRLGEGPYQRTSEIIDWALARLMIEEVNETGGFSIAGNQNPNRVIARDNSKYSGPRKSPCIEN